MTEAIELGASDLPLTPRRPPVARVNGALVSLGKTVLEDPDTEILCRELCDDRHWDELQRVGTTDLGLAHESGNRFRVSCLRQRGRMTAVLRLIPNRLLSFDQIGLPQPCQELLRRPRGPATSSKARGVPGTCSRTWRRTAGGLSSWSMAICGSRV